MSRGKLKKLPFWRRYGIAIAAVVAVTTVSVGIALMALPPKAAADAPRVTVYKNPHCQCCTVWVRHLQEAGFAVESEHLADLAAIRTRLGVPQQYAACHTAEIEGYAIEGHVPAADIKRLVAERPEARGLAVPGMPIGSPGMEGSNPQDYSVHLLQSDGSAQVYAQYPTEKASAQ